MNRGASVPACENMLIVSLFASGDARSTDGAMPNGPGDCVNVSRAIARFRNGDEQLVKRMNVILLTGPLLFHGNTAARPHLNKISVATKSQRYMHSYAFNGKDSKTCPIRKS